MIRCARGCVVPGRHTPGCHGCHCDCHTTIRGGVSVPCGARGDGCTDKHGACTGCEVMPASYGVLCGRCDRRLRDMLGDRENPEGPHGFPWVYAWLGENLDPITNPRSGDGRGSRDEAPTPIRLDVLVVRGGIEVLLEGWVDATIDLYPAGRLKGPETRTAGTLSRWLLAQITIVESAPFAADIVTELDEMMGEAHRWAPWRPANRVLSGVPCPWCHTPALRIRGGEIDVTCGYCGAWIDHDRYQMWARYLAESVSPRARKQASA